MRSMNKFSIGKYDTSDALIKSSLDVEQVYLGRPKLYPQIDFYPCPRELRKFLILYSKTYVYSIRDLGGGEARIP